MKQRLLVMNGQRVLQGEVDGQWTNQKVNKAGELKAGIYNLYAGAQAEKSKKHAGVIVHADSDSVYQQTGKNIVVHSRADFDKVPEIGSSKLISYDSQGKASATSNTQQQERSRSR